MSIRSVNPATGALLRVFEPLNAEALESRLELARNAAQTYREEPLSQRAFWMRRLALLLDADTEELAATVTAEMGKTLASARQEVAKCAAACRFYAEHAEEFLKPEPVATGHQDSYIRYDPLGVVLAIMPWNFPLWQVFRFLAPALMAGNVGLLKHAINVPQCALAIEALVRRAGFPRGTFQSLLIELGSVENVLADERVAAVTLTGSEAAGRAVAAQAGWLLKKSVLELGGSDAFIVMPSADLEAAAQNAAGARCINTGQSCIAAKRFLVHTEVYDRFQDLFVQAMQRLSVGDPMQPETEVGPLAHSQILNQLLAQISAAVDSGGQILTGGERIAGAGNYVQPTVIAGVPRTAAVSREETFGPLALLFRVESLEDAISLANDTPFGLGASVWTSESREQDDFARRLEAGSVFFNTPVASDPRLPFGGVKHSGYGRELGRAGMLEFMNLKTVVVGGSAKQQQAAFAFAETAGESRVEAATPPADTEPITAETPSSIPPRRTRGILQLD